MDDVVFDGIPVIRYAKITEKLPLNSKVASASLMAKIRASVSNFTAAIQREFFFLFSLDKNVSLTFVM